MIITGRVADAAVTLAPMMFEFGWSPTDWDRLAAGIVAGHIIECGAQCTGGNFTDWHLVKSYRRHRVSRWSKPSAGWQLRRDEASEHRRARQRAHGERSRFCTRLARPAYMTPDVVARFDSVHLEQEGPDRVRVTGARGEPAPAEAESVAQLSRRLARVRPAVRFRPRQRSRKRTRSPTRSGTAPAGADSTSRRCISSSAGMRCHPPLATCEPGEVLVQFAVRDHDERKINSRFAPQTRAPRAGDGARDFLHRRSGSAARIGSRRVLAGAGFSRGCDGAGADGGGRDPIEGVRPLSSREGDRLPHEPLSLTPFFTP